MQDDLKKLAEKVLKDAEKATDRPWNIHATSEYVIDSPKGTVGMLGGINNLVNNGEFITTSANSTERLAKAVIVLSEALEKIESHPRRNSSKKGNLVLIFEMQDIAFSVLTKANEIARGE